MENLKKARKAKGYTAEQLANLLGYSKGTINKYEQGVFEPDIKTLKKLSELLDCSIDYLVGNEEGITITKEEYSALIKAKEAIDKIEKRQTAIRITNNIKVQGDVLINSDKKKKKE